MAHPYIFIKNAKWYIKVPYSEVLYIEALKKYIRIVTTKGKFVIVGSIKEAEHQLPLSSFCRIHRSFIISLDSITAFSQDIVKIGLKEFPLGRQYKKSLFEKVPILFGDLLSKDSISPL